MSVKASIILAMALGLSLSMFTYANDQTAADGTVTAAHQSDDDVIEVECVVTKDPVHGSASALITPQDFSAAGFVPGDSCDVCFSNGYSLTDVPLYNGFYVHTGEPLVVVYPGFDYICITYNNQGIWADAGLEEGDTVTIRRNTPGKYLTMQEALNQTASYDPADYESEEAYCNFRSLSGGQLKKNLLFRGSSPVDNSYGRAAAVDELLAKYGIRQVLDLADTQEEFLKYQENDDFASPYSISLDEEGQYHVLGMSSAYAKDDYKQKLVDGLRQMLASGEEPVYIQCKLGKDRTGFVCMLLEALAGATYLEMANDYMLTYETTYSIDPEQDRKKYEAIRALYFDEFMQYLLGTDAVELIMDSDYTGAAEAYLREGGMTEEEIRQLEEFISSDVC